MEFYGKYKTQIQINESENPLDEVRSEILVEGSGPLIQMVKEAVASEPETPTSIQMELRSWE